MATLQKALSANSSSSSFPSRVATTTTPSGLRSTNFKPGLSTADWFVEGVKNLFVLPYGTGSNDTTFSLRIIGWRSTANGLWVPTILCEVACTLCTSVGVAGADVVDTERFCDTLSLVTNLGNEDVSVELLSPQNNTPGHIVLDTKGCEYVEFVYDMTGATDANALVGVM